MAILIVAVALALCISCLCSLTEATLLSLSLTDIAHISDRHPQIGRIWREFREDIHRPISVILVVNTLANTMGASISGAQFSILFGSKWIAPFSALFSFAVIQWAEILPKTLAVRYNRFLALILAFPLKAGVQLLAPAVNIIEFINRPFQLMGHCMALQSNALQDLSILTRFAAVNRLITNEQARIVFNSINLSHLRVREIMVKREEVKYLSDTMSLSEALIASHVHHHTRYLLAHKNDIDKIIGYINFKDVVSALQINPADPSLNGIKRPVLAVKDTDDLATVLRMMIAKHHHIAVVKDAADKTAGLITLEDIIETFIGQIQDEYDILPRHAYAIAEKYYMVGGGITLCDLQAKTGVKLPPISKTLDEWIRLTVLNRVPGPEEKISLEGVEFVIKKTRRSRIYELTMRLLNMDKKNKGAGPMVSYPEAG